MLGSDDYIKCSNHNHIKGYSYSYIFGKRVWT